ncbi:hypothetical protein DHW03_01670 [Pedobacter yonginense]|uniref:Uncharacterized protein n=1 Tax=Pedobacter yonginense TaxID=651869 RepID=A0A317ER21_9SPHI|nr:hypothetical protein [Pedobacter yonginense]PWS28587.1 hypothetical protein DHW03_01670 [Pedobacter yonginense]
MKKMLLAALVMLLFINAKAAINVQFGYLNAAGETLAISLKNDMVISEMKTFKDLKAFTISSALTTGHFLRIKINGETFADYKTSGEIKKYEAKNTIIEKEINIEHWDSSSGTEVQVSEDLVKFKILPIKESKVITETNSDGTDGCAGCLIAGKYQEIYAALGLEQTPFGLYQKGSKTIHLFFDQDGNSIGSTVPQGIANAKYVIHIIYAFSSADTKPIRYSIKQKSGSFNGSLNFENENIRKGGLNFQGGKTYDAAAEKTFLLGTATDDLSFDIIATKDDGTTVKKATLESYTIKMSPVYHGSFDVGLLKTDLINPTFSNIASPSGSGMVVKQTDASSKGVVTIMASYYASPVIILRHLLMGKKSDVPFYKLGSRNYLDDHKFYERIYPTLGVGISNKTFENFFYGFNFELARGLNLFAGWHYGKVNTFEMPGFQAGVTAVSPEQFEYYKNTTWKNQGAIGVKIDAMIFKNLFGL